ncbi:hypothetical protein [Inquilinus limosus]|uniref:hypothetical protein n=1 Tax=Inquilinus limosus TaxID=171674 RepID=UPI0009DDD520|nr:hypothetical protein [Inquilinus limosus]
MKLFGKRVKRSSEVFGISSDILSDSYVDRGSLDAELQKQLTRSNHIALRGESKCGKSWIRKKIIPNAIVIQCRLKKDVPSIYEDILAELGIQIVKETSEKNNTKATLQINGSIGANIIAKIGTAFGVEQTSEGSTTYRVPGKGPENLQFLCEAIKASGRRVVIEDFHYMSVADRRVFAHDLKTMWDYGTYIIIVGVWSQSNMLISLNTDLSGRIEEISIYWTDDDLKAILERGGEALNIEFKSPLKDLLIADAFGNAGILQKLSLNTLDELEIGETQKSLKQLDREGAGEAAGMKYAEQLNPAYQQFANRISSGIRKRSDATGIYAHAMAVIMSSGDDDLKKGLSVDDIHKQAHARQPRIQKGNLKAVLEKFEELQVDDDGRGLVLSYNNATNEIHIVDRQLLLYRKYATVKWPWEDMIREVDGAGPGYGSAV